MQTPEVAVFIRTALSKIALLSCLLILTACGQKGPLYLPQEPNAAPQAVTSEPAEAEAATSKDKPKASAPTDSQD